MFNGSRLHSVFLFFYSVVLCVSLIPYWIWCEFRYRNQGTGAEKQRRRERLALGIYPRELQGRIMIHAASVGEGVAAVSLARSLISLNPELPILLTCTTFTGAERLQRDLKGTIPQIFFPFDTPGAMARFLDKLSPQGIILIERELWPNLLTCAKRRSIPVIVANARLSPNAARSYARFHLLSYPIFSSLALVLAQSRAIARRFNVLGAEQRCIHITGNVKFDPLISQVVKEKAILDRQELGDRLVLLAASTHPGEDEALLEAWSYLRGLERDPLLVLVPRHPHRFNIVADLIVKHGYTLYRNSRHRLPKERDPLQSVFLGDTMGEMLSWAALANVVFVGGSLVQHGGHSPIEAMAFHRPIVSGRNVQNFIESYRALDKVGAVAWVEDLDSKALENTLGILLSDPSRCKSMGEMSSIVLNEMKGASMRSAKIISEFFSDTKTKGHSFRTIEYSRTNQN